MPSVFGMDGKKVKDISLPPVFHTAYDANLIKRAVLAVQSSRVQPFGTKRGAGRSNTAEYIGVRGKPNPYKTINVGHARLPRLRNRRGILYGKVASVPQAVGGPRAHPPKIQERNEEYINTKERKKAILSAASATMDSKIVKARGHRFDDKTFPLIVDVAFEKIKKTQDVLKVMALLGIEGDIDHAKNTKKTRAGKNKNRGRRFRQKKTVLIVTNGTKPIYKAARNLPGVDVVAVQSLNAEHLAPGSVAGRLTIWAEDALSILGKKGDQ